MAQEITAYQIKVVLNETEPLVWRRLVVLSNMSLNNLSWSINFAMGWECSHLYLFEVNGKVYGNIDYDDEGGWLNDRTIQIRDLVHKGVSSFRYIYDFGDDWQHGVVIEKEMQAHRDLRYPICSDGQYACPPEDCGGPHGFAEYKTALKNVHHPRHQEFFEWRGPYDPEKFDLKLTQMKMVSKKIPKNLKIKRLSSI